MPKHDSHKRGKKRKRRRSSDGGSRAGRQAKRARTAVPKVRSLAPGSGLKRQEQVVLARERVVGLAREAGICLGPIKREKPGETPVYYQNTELSVVPVWSVKSEAPDLATVVDFLVTARASRQTEDEVMDAEYVHLRNWLALTNNQRAIYSALTQTLPPNHSLTAEDRTIYVEPYRPNKFLLAFKNCLLDFTDPDHPTIRTNDFGDEDVPWHFLPAELDLVHADDPFHDLSATPDIAHIFATQKWTNLTTYWFMVHVGSLMYPLDYRDASLKSILYLWGPPRTGKSTLARMILGFVPPEARGTINSEGARTFRYENVPGKRIAHIEEMTDRSDIGRDEINKMADGGDMTINAKFKNQVGWSWNVPVLITGNKMFPNMVSDDEVNSVLRRLAIFPTNYSVADDKEQLDLEQRVLEQSPLFLYKCLLARANSRRHYGHRAFRQDFSDQMLNAKDLAARSTEIWDLFFSDTATEEPSANPGIPGRLDMSVAKKRVVLYADANGFAPPSTTRLDDTFKKALNDRGWKITRGLYSRDTGRSNCVAIEAKLKDHSLRWIHDDLADGTWTPPIRPERQNLQSTNEMTTREQRIFFALIE